MKRFVALLAAVNVGGRKVPMSDLRALAEKLGFHDPKTYIQSGNLVFGADGAAKAVLSKLEAAMEKRFGFHIHAVLRTKAEWAAYAAACPFEEECKLEPNRVFLLVSAAPPKADAAKMLEARGVAGERLRLVGDALWAHYRAGAGSTKLTPSLVDRLVGSKVTARNYRTVLAIGDLMASGSAPD